MLIQGKEIKDFVVKFVGKISLLEPLELSHNYKISVDSTVTSETDIDNNDGTINKIYRVEPILGEVIKSNGATIKIKDGRRNSEKIRKVCYAVWSTQNTKIDSDEMYNKVTNWVLLNMEQIQEQICKKE